MDDIKSTSRSSDAEHTQPLLPAKTMVDHKFGVVYTPANVYSHSDQQVDLSDDAWLDSLGVKYIRITWADYINNIRYRVVPRKYFKKLLQSSRPGVSITKACFGIVVLALAPNFSGTGEYLYVIDQNSFRVSPYAPGHATVFGYFQEKEPHPQYGLEVPLCPRKLLKDVVDRARSDARVSYLVGFESEFILLSQTSPKIVPVNVAVPDSDPASFVFVGIFHSTVLVWTL